MLVYMSSKDLSSTDTLRFGDSSDKCVSHTNGIKNNNSSTVLNKNNIGFTRPQTLIAEQGDFILPMFPAPNTVPA